MALWKPLMGNHTALDTVEKHDGWIYFCIDDGSLFFDYADADGNLQRKQITAKEAEKILGYNIANILNADNSEIPTSKAVLDALEVLKLDISNTAAVILAEAQTDAINKDIVILAEAQMDATNKDIVILAEAQMDASNKDVVILAEAQKSVETEKTRAEKAEQALNNRIEEVNKAIEEVQPGKDGISATHSWNGTVLTITSASGTSSADLKGEKGDKPVKGTDYFTEADKNELVDAVLAALPNAEGVGF